jgi:hypothetical protein
LLADILGYMLRNPWSANIDCAWFIYYLEKPESRDIDFPRVACVLNRLHEMNRYAAMVLCQTLSSFLNREDGDLLIDLILNTGKVSATLIDSLKEVSLNPPRRGERTLISYPHLFVSYSRKDIALMRRISSNLRDEGFKTWTDEFLEPGTPQWELAIETAIRDSGAFVVVLTPQSCESEWVRKEIELASAFTKRVYPILADGNEDTAMLDSVASVQRVDLRKNFHSGMSSLAQAIRRFLMSQAQ